MITAFGIVSHCDPETGAPPDRMPPSATVPVAFTLAFRAAVCQIRGGMDLTFDPAQEEFRAEARAWLSAHVPGKPCSPIAGRW
jgi:hypothetical protein